MTFEMSRVDWIRGFPGADGGGPPGRAGFDPGVPAGRDCSEVGLAQGVELLRAIGGASEQQGAVIRSGFQFPGIQWA